MNAAEHQATHNSERGAEKCNFCNDHLPFDLKIKLTQGCMTCSASWRDQYIAELLMGFECLDGVRTFSRLSKVLEERKRRIAVVGRLFKRDGTNLQGQCHQFNVSQLRRVTRRRMRLPVRSASLDYLLVGDAESMIFSMDEVARALSDRGVLVVLWSRGGKTAFQQEEARNQDGNVFSVCATQIQKAGQAGLVAWIDRPGLSVPRIQHLETFTALKPAAKPLDPKNPS